jgi:hypothetical protein
MVIDEFPVIIGDYSVPRDGPPIALDAKATRSWAIDLDRFECICPERRRRHELFLSVQERTLMLLLEGYSLGEIDWARVNAFQVRLQREESSKDPSTSTKHRLSKAFKKLTARAIKNVIGAPERNQSTAMSA